MMRLHRGWLSVFVLGLAVGFLAGAARAADEKGKATGTWKSSFTTNAGQTFETTFKLKQAGNKLTGTVSGRNGQETPIEKGTVKGSEVSFQVTREFQGQKVVIHYKGKVEGDAIKGKVEFKRGDQARERDWEAKRQKG